MSWKWQKPQRSWSNCVLCSKIVFSKATLLLENLQQTVKANLKSHLIGRELFYKKNSQVIKDCHQIKMLVKKCPKVTLASFYGANYNIENTTTPSLMAINWSAHTPIIVIRVTKAHSELLRMPIGYCSIWTTSTHSGSLRKESNTFKLLYWNVKWDFKLEPRSLGDSESKKNIRLYGCLGASERRFVRHSIIIGVSAFHICISHWIRWHILVFAKL